MRPCCVTPAKEIGMPRINSRPLFLLLLILLFVVTPVLAIAGVDLTVTIAHTGNAGTSNHDFLVNSTTGSVSVVVQNTGDTATTNPIQVVVTLASGLTYGGTFT